MNNEQIISNIVERAADQIAINWITCGPFTRSDLSAHMAYRAIQHVYHQFDRYSEERQYLWHRCDDPTLIDAVLAASKKLLADAF